MWTYQGKEFTETPEEYQGFVYEITELDTGKSISVKNSFGSQRSYQRTRLVREEFVQG